MLLVERNFSKPVRILEATGAQLPDGVLLQLIYPVCNIGELNANKRMYEKELWDLVLENQDLQEKLSNRTLYGQAEHPKETASDLQLTSHIIHEMWIGEDNRVYQTFDVLDTPCGRIIECLIRAGSKVGVSTRAEGDLEEAVNEETGEKYHRVVPKSYRYVTTDFTADPSTFGAMAVDVKKNIITAARTAAESKTSKKGEIRFARQILESLECDHKKTCQNCGACKCRKGEGSDMKSTVAEAIKSGKLTEGKVVSLVVKTRTGKTKYTRASVKKISEGRLDIQLNSTDPNSRSMVIDGTDAVTIRPDGTMDVFASGSGPYETSKNSEDELANALGAEEGSPAPEIKAEEEVHRAHEEAEIPGEENQKESPIESKANESQINEKTTWEDLGWTVGTTNAPDLKGFTVRNRKSGDTYKIIRSNEKYLQLKGRKDPLPVGDAFVYTKEWELLDPEGSPVQVNKKTSNQKSSTDQSKANEGSECTKKEKRQFKHIAKAEVEAGKSKGRAEEIAGATVTKQKSESRLTERVENLIYLFVCTRSDVGAQGEEQYLLCGDFENSPEPITLFKSFDRGEVAKVGKNIAFLMHVPFEDENAHLPEDSEEAGELEKQWSQPSPEGIPNESKVNEHCGFCMGTPEDNARLLGITLRVQQEKHVDLKGAIPIVARLIDKSPEETRELIDKAVNADQEPFEEEFHGETDPLKGKRMDSADIGETPDFESKLRIPPLDALIDLRIKEACTRAERDTLLENKDVQVRILASRLQEATKEIAGLRVLVEKKTSALKESTKPNKDVKKLNEDIKSQHASHQQELVKTASKSKNDGRNEVLKDYFDQRLSACRLEADDNTQALLERCKSLEDVDQLIESLVRVAQRGALHPHPLKDVVVRERKTDPEQDKIDKQVGGLMKGWSA